MRLTDSSAWLSMREQTRKSSRDVLTRGRVAVRSQLPEAKPEAAAVAVIRATVHSFVPVATRTRNPRPLVPPITPAARLENSTAQLRPLLLACYSSPPLIMPPHFCDNETHGRPIMTVYLDTLGPTSAPIDSSTDTDLCPETRRRASPIISFLIGCIN